MAIEHRSIFDFAQRLRPGGGLRQVNRKLRSIEEKLDRLEYFSNGGRSTYVGNNRVLVKTVVQGVHIAYLVEADDKLLSPYFIITGDYESFIKDAIIDHLKPDSRCIDVGSNFGFFSCVMARFCPEGQIIAVEPGATVFALTQDNFWINGLANGRAIHAAASDQAGELTLFRRATRSGNTSITAVSEAFTASLGEPPAEPFTVPSVRIDDLVRSFDGRLDMMKIDVEGAEPLVFRGARQTIADNRQLIVVMEWSPGQIQSAGFDVADFVADLGSMDLVAYDIVGRSLKRLSLDALQTLSYRAGIVLTQDATLA